MFNVCLVISRLLIAAYVVTQTLYFALLSLNSLMKVFHFIFIFFWSYTIKVVDLVLSYVVFVVCYRGCDDCSESIGDYVGILSCESPAI